MSEPRHHVLGLTDEQVIHMFVLMLKARRLDERMLLLNRAGKVPFVISCQGQEGAQVGAAFALDQERDYLLPYYRDVAMMLAFGMSSEQLMLQSFAKGADPNSGGRQMPGHFGSKKLRIVTGSSPVATQIPHAVGIALAGRMDDKSFVTCVTFGEGSSNQGDFHEGLNFAGVHRLPVIFLCQNNHYAISVPLKKQLACASVADRAVGYGMPGYQVDGQDVLEVYHVMKQAVERARNGEGPTLIEANVYRFAGHSSDDDDRSYRDQTEVAEAKRRDPLFLFQQYLIDAQVLDENSVNRLEEQIKHEVNESTEAADQAPFADNESIMNHVYAE